MSNKYRTIVQFINELENSSKECAEAHIKEKPETEQSRYAYQYGHALGTLNGLLYRLDLTDQQFEVLKTFFK